MRDPFPFKPPPRLYAVTQKLSSYLNFTTLPLHAHEFLLAALFYHTICTHISPYVSRRLFPTVYPSLPRRTKLNWDVHVVSLVQSVTICTVALWVLWNDEERKQMDYRGRIWGYTGACGLVQALAGGYFFWDLWLTAMHLDVFGPGLLAHAVSALFVYSLGYRPFVVSYAPVFILFELSSPFLNFHWFFDKLNMTGSNAQLYNGVVLMSTFFGARLVWGPYSSYCAFSDIWRAMQYQRTVEGKAWLQAGAAAASALAGGIGKDAQGEVLKYVGGQEIPNWLPLVYVVSNTVLMVLNVYWFGKMVDTIRARFAPPFGTRKTEKKEVVVERGDGRNSVEIREMEISHRGKKVKGSLPPPS